MIPLSLVTGFLGSGKTTLLQHLVERYRDRRIAYIVNEFGTVDVDGQLLDLEPDRIISLPGGSIFCRCLTTEFLGTLRTVGEKTAADLDGVVIEASGMADPRVVTQMLADGRLDTAYDVRSIIAVIDPGRFLKLIHTLASVVAQVEACGLAIINKTDLYREADIAAAEHEVRQHNPAADVIRAEHCDADVDVFDRAAPAGLEGEYALCRDPNFVTETASLTTPIDADRLLAELRSVQDRVHRVKGFVPTADGVLHIDLTPATLNARALAPPDASSSPTRPGDPGHLVFIGPPDAAPLMTLLAERLRNGDFDGSE